MVDFGGRPKAALAYFVTMDGILLLITNVRPPCLIHRLQPLTGSLEHESVVGLPLAGLNF